MVSNRKRKSNLTKKDYKMILKHYGVLPKNRKTKKRTLQKKVIDILENKFVNCKKYVGNNRKGYKICKHSIYKNRGLTKLKNNVLKTVKNIRF